MLKSASDEVSKGNQKHVIGYWKKSYLCYKAAENLATLHCTAGWRAEIHSPANLDI